MSHKVALIFETNEERDQLVGKLKPMSSVSISAHVGGARSLQGVMVKEKPDVVLLALLRPDDAAFEVIEAATLRHPSVLVLLVSEDTGLTTLKRAMRAGVRDVLPGPLNAASVQAGVDYVKDSESITSRFVDNEGTLYAFMSAKGGCGATFLVTNLAYLLAKASKRVLIVDLNLYFGDAASYLTSRKSEVSVVDVARQSRRLDGSLLEASVLKVRDNLHVLCAPELPYKLEEVTPETVAAILALARTEYDFVLLDMARTMDPAAVKALDLAERIYLVTGQTLPALQDTLRMIAVFEGLGYGREKIMLVLNRYTKSSQIPLGEVERTTGYKVARVLPASDDAVLASINQGIPLAKLAARDPVARALNEWAQALAPVAVNAGGKPSWFSTLTGGM
jgi:pilus assembly protein CpaE